MINYSIIVPFRDKYDLMRKAVSSIPDRSDIQIILVYNGHNEFPSPYLPVTKKSIINFLISSPDKGAGHARNCGLDITEGQYILFLDADDFYTDIAFKTFDQYLDKDADIVFFKPTSISLSTGTLSKRHVLYSDRLERFIISGNEDELRYRWEVPWCKMYRADYIKKNNIRFDETKVSNDAWFSLQSGYLARKILADTTTVYVVTEGETGQSLVKSKTPETNFIRFKVAIKINQFLYKIHKRHMRIRLLGFINIAFKEFGIAESWNLLQYAIINKINIF